MVVGCAGWDDAIRVARAAPTLAIGLHFNLLVGSPRSGAACLRGADGRFPSLGVLAWRAVTGRLDRSEVRAECEAQLGALRGAGIAVTHIDSHRHVHALPTVHAAVAEVAAANRLPLRRSIETPIAARRSPALWLRRTLVATAWTVSQRGAPRTRSVDHFTGMSLMGDPEFARRVGGLIDALPAGTTELMVHPGHVDAELEAIDGYTTARERELAALTSPALLAHIARSGVELVGFGAL